MNSVITVKLIKVLGPRKRLACGRVVYNWFFRTVAVKVLFLCTKEVHLLQNHISSKAQNADRLESFKSAN